MSTMDEALYAFLIESAENLARLEEDIVALEVAPKDTELLASIFRAVHTIKGTCGFFGFNHIEIVTHAAEDALGRLRDGKINLTRELTSALFELIDAVRHMLALIETTGSDGESNYEELIAHFKRLENEVESTEALSQAPLQIETEKNSALLDNAIRVDIALLDKLMNVVGELVLARNQIIQYASMQLDSSLTNSAQRLNFITTELQEGVMKTRMQPISTIWSAFPRLVRDLEDQTGKKIRLEREGGDTDLDRGLLQAIKDPLTHLLRNAADHGLEATQERVEAGKPATGTIRLRAFHESGYVIVDVSDDGKGIDTQKVIQSAVIKGLLRTDQADKISERDAMSLLFMPGFSTADKVTNISGRGVGLDVVKNNIEKVGGSIDIQTEAGKGTTFKIKIPLTLAIIPALITECDGERYAIPQVNLLEIVRLDATEVSKKIERVHSASVYRLRGKLLPLVDLRDALNLSARNSSQDVHILVLQADRKEFGLVVDEVRDTEEIVVKPLGRHLKNVTCFAGATIMGDGRVALILDAVAIAQIAHVINNMQQSVSWPSAEGNLASVNIKKNPLLIFELSGSGLGAIPLEKVERLEEIHYSKIEYARGCRVIQYRDKILPLISIDELLTGQHKDFDESATLKIIVHRSGNVSFGLMVEEIMDVIDHDVSAESMNSEDVIGDSVIVNGRVLDLINIDYITKNYKKLVSVRAEKEELLN